MQADNEYKKLLDLVLTKGRRKKNRTGVDTFGVFGAQARFDLSKGFPLLTTKKVAFKSIIHELLWFISGSTNIKYLVDNDCNIWNANAFDRFKKSVQHNPPFDQVTEEQFVSAIQLDESFARQWGDLGEGTYGGMWRAFPYFKEKHEGVPCIDHNFYQSNLETVDQLAKVNKQLLTNPDDRRIIVSAWHPYWVDHCALPPCHVLFHFNTEELTTLERREEAYRRIPRDHWESNTGVPYPYNDEDMDKEGIPKRRLNCLLYQRSCDLFLGVPFNIASYALLTSMIAQCVNMIPGEFVHTYGDLHLYENHIEQAKEQIAREPFESPKLALNPKVKDLFKFQFSDINLLDYKSHPPIKAKMAV